MFVFISTLYYLYFSIVQLFVKKSQRQDLWRRGVRGHNALMLRIAGVTLKLHHLPEKLEYASLIVSNHPTMMDGFTYFSLYGPNVIPVTGPARYFAFPFGRVFSNMGAIHTARTDEEEMKFPDSYSRKDSVEAMKAALKDERHVLIFPEGHVEQTKQLYYVHTGAARVALSTGRPLAVFGVTGVEHVIVDHTRMRPGTLHIHFSGYIHPKKSTSQPSQANVKQLQKKIEDAFVDLLPHRYIPDYISYKKPTEVAAFIDIDNTLYKGVFSKDVIVYFMKKNVIPRWRGFYVLWLLLMEALQLMPHRMVMKKAHRVLRDMKPSHVQALGKEFFDAHGKHQMNDVMEALIKNHRERGHAIVLVTEMTSPLAKLFSTHIKADALFATELLVSGGTYNGRIEKLNYAEEKARALHHYAKKHGISLKKSYAYGDSFSGDHHMLKTVGHPVAMHPSHALKAYARKKKWKIIG